MPTTAFKRVAVPVDENLYNALQKLAKATNGSVAGTASRWLKESEHQIFALASALELAKSDPVAAAQALQRVTLEAQRQLAEEQLDMLSQG